MSRLSNTVNLNTTITPERSVYDTLVDASQFDKLLVFSENPPPKNAF